MTSIFKRAEDAAIKVALELYLSKRLGKNTMASPIVQEIIAAVESLFTTGSATLSIPAVSEQVLNYTVTEGPVPVTIKKNA